MKEIKVGVQQTVNRAQYLSVDAQQVNVVEHLNSLYITLTREQVKSLVEWLVSDKPLGFEDIASVV